MLHVWCVKQYSLLPALLAVLTVAPCTYTMLATSKQFIPQVRLQLYTG